MAFFIRNGLRTWCGDLRWREYERAPSLLVARKEARALGATHTVRSRDLPGWIGFVTIDRNDANQPLHSLLVAAAAKAGPRYYGNYEIGVGEHWIIATDDKGRPLPGSDSVHRADAVAQVRSTFDGHSFDKEEELKSREVEALLELLADAPLAVRSVSLRPYVLTAAACVAVAGLGLETAHLLHQHRLAVQQEQARLALERLRRHPPPPPAPVEPPPAEWVSGCVAGVSALPPYAHGWILTKVDCQHMGIQATWARAGGTVLTAPKGDITNDGATVTSHLALEASFERHVPADPAFGQREMIAILQRAGIAPHLGQTAVTVMNGNHQVTTSIASIDFHWPGDPRAIEWDRFGDAHVLEMSRSILDTQSGSSTSPGWEIRLTLAKPVPPGAARHP